MSLDEFYSVDTPENIEFGYTIAGIGSRFLAAIIDTGLLIILQIVLVVALFGGLALLEELGGAPPMLAGLTLAVFAILSFIFFWGYFLFFELIWNGQSPGKRLIRLRVVREGGRPITFAASALRNLVRFIDFLPGFYGLGVLVMFIDRKARRLGDLTGGTLVVKERAAVSLDALTSVSAQAPPPPPKDANAPPMLTNIHTLTEKDYDLVQEFLRRREQLGRDSRRALGLQLAEGIRSRLDVRLQNADHERFLEQVALDYRRARAEQTEHVADSR